MPLGKRHELQLIVGRGSHAADGEASLSRAVQNHLRGREYRFELRGGVLIVQIHSRRAR